MEIKIRSEGVEQKEVSPHGSSGRIYVPKEWTGKEVLVILPKEGELMKDEKNEAE